MEFWRANLVNCHFTFGFCKHYKCIFMWVFTHAIAHEYQCVHCAEYVFPIILFMRKKSFTNFLLFFSFDLPPVAWSRVFLLSVLLYISFLLLSYPFAAQCYWIILALWLINCDGIAKTSTNLHDGCGNLETYVCQHFLFAFFV